MQVGYDTTVGNSYQFITIYNSAYKFSCLESQINTDINLDLEFQIYLEVLQRKDKQTKSRFKALQTYVVPLPVSTRTQSGLIRDASAVEIKSQNLDEIIVACVRRKQFSSSHLYVSIVKCGQPSSLG